MTNAYLYAGSTLMLAGLIDEVNNTTHRFSGAATRCRLCRASIAMRMFQWRRKQARLEWCYRITRPWERA